MKKLICIMALIVCQTSVWAQHHFRVTEVPVFRSVDDSIAYTNSQHIFQQIVAGKISNLSADSILSYLRTIGEQSIIGRKKTYSASKDFVSINQLDSIKLMGDVTRLSISNTTHRKLPGKIFTYKNLQYLELVNTSTRRLQKLHKLPNIKSILCIE
jgi:hypothetical protein